MDLRGIDKKCRDLNVAKATGREAVVPKILAANVKTATAAPWAKGGVETVNDFVGIEFKSKLDGRIILSILRNLKRHNLGQMGGRATPNLGR